MRRWSLRQIVGLAAVAGSVALLFAVSLVWGRSPAGVDWLRVRAVAIESDDWGLCGFVPDSAAAAALDRDVLAPGRLPEVYWNSTLEDSAAVASLAAVLGRHRGRDGLPALIQPNYIMASLGFASTSPGDIDRARWTTHVLPDVAPRYDRPGLWAAVHEARRRGVWQPELHGRWHYDPEMRRERTGTMPEVQQAARAQILPFPGSERAWELGPWRTLGRIGEELDENLAAFTDLFGAAPRSVIAPDYVWDDVHEELWLDRGLRVIQGQRQQRKATWRGMEGRIRKVLHRSWARWVRRDRVYLDRNCIFEPVQQGDPRAITSVALADARAAWDRGEPAIIEAHRINFAHLDPAIGELGRSELDTLLRELSSDAPLFLADDELGDLHRRGTSWTVRGETIVVRNLSRSRRLVVVPPRALAAAAAFAGRQEGVRSEPLVVALGAGQTRRLGLAAFIEP
jgi:hypothetical protein